MVGPKSLANLPGFKNQFLLPVACLGHFQLRFSGLQVLETIEKGLFDAEAQVARFAEEGKRELCIEFSASPRLRVDWVVLQIVSYKIGIDCYRLAGFSRSDWLKKLLARPRRTAINLREYCLGTHPKLRFYFVAHSPQERLNHT